MVAALTLLAPAGTGALTAFGVSLTTAGGGLTLAGTLLNVGGSLLLSAASSALSAGRASSIEPSTLQQNSKAASASRVGHYGLVKTGGNVVFHRVNGDFIYRIIVHGHGEISNVRQVYLNNAPVDLDADGFVTDDLYQHERSRVQVQHRLGVVPETHYGALSEVFPHWTADHRLDGQATSLVICEAVPRDKFNEMYPAREPDVQILAETAKLYDPRTAQTIYSDNLALAIRDFVASPDGLNQPSLYSDDNIAEQADIADRALALATGGTEPQWRVSGSYALSEQPKAVLARMLAVGAGQIRLLPSGQHKLSLGAWEEPEFTLTDDHIHTVDQFDGGPTHQKRYNELPAQFVSHALGHQEVSADPWIDQDRLANDGGRLVGPQQDMLMSPTQRQTRHALQIKTERDNPAWKISLLCYPSALPAYFEERVQFDFQALGLSGPCELDGASLVFDGANLTGVRLNLRAVNPASFVQRLEDQGRVQDLPEPDAAQSMPIPTFFDAVGAGVQTSANTFGAGIAASWVAAPADSLSPRLRYSHTGQDNWQDMDLGSGTTSAQISGLNEGQGYNVSLAFVSPGGVVGEAVVIANVIAAAAATPPAPPTGLIVTDNGDGTALVELTTSVSPDLYQTEIYRDGVGVAVLRDDHSTQVSLIDHSGAGTFDWTARSVNVSTTNSTTDAGPITATIA